MSKALYPSVKAALSFAIALAISGCVSEPARPQGPSEREQLAAIDPNKNIDLAEARIIFANLQAACVGGKYFIRRLPVLEYNGLWLGSMGISQPLKEPIGYHGAWVMPSEKPVILDPKTGSVLIDGISIGHYSRMYEECPKLPKDSPQ